jgi:hypothetical protein
LRSLLRAILAIVLLLGSGVADWSPVRTQAHESCCCGMPAEAGDSCPCPKPEGNRTPQQGTCGERSSVVLAQASLGGAVQRQRRTEPQPEPTTWALAREVREASGMPAPVGGRDPDLGRHLAQLSAFRI